MVPGMSAVAVDWMFVGALGVSLLHAARRHEWPWVLALGLPLLFCADRAGLAGGTMAWACAFYAATAIAFLVMLAARALGLTGGFGLVAAGAVLSLSAGAADARHLALASPTLAHPPLVGVELRGWLHRLRD